MLLLNQHKFKSVQHITKLWINRFIYLFIYFSCVTEMQKVFFFHISF